MKNAVRSLLKAEEDRLAALALVDDATRRIKLVQDDVLRELDMKSMDTRLVRYKNLISTIQAVPNGFIISTAEVDEDV